MAAAGRRDGGRAGVRRVYLAGVATPAGYRTLLAPPVSALSLGPVHTLFAMMLARLRERAAGAAIPELTVAVLARLAVTSRAAARARRLGPATGEVA